MTFSDAFFSWLFKGYGNYEGKLMNEILVLIVSTDIQSNLLIIWKNGSFRKKENLPYKKTADSVLLSLFRRTNGKGNNSHAP